MGEIRFDATFKTQEARGQAWQSEPVEFQVAPEYRSTYLNGIRILPGDRLFATWPRGWRIVRDVPAWPRDVVRRAIARAMEG